MPACRFAVPLLLVCTALFPARAHADRIDGNWCSREGRLLSIDGNHIVTPFGNRLVGEYGRHTFVYRAEAGETGAGGEVQMRQLNDETIHILWPDEVEVEVWNRCDVTS